MSNYIQFEKETVIDSSGKIISYGFEKFKDDIFNGNNCFICGANPEDKDFNDEHIIPKWVLKYCGLFKEFITLPNAEKIRYDRYVLPCCSECNTFYGQNLEDKVRPLITQPFDKFNEQLTDENLKLLYIWLSFLLFKTHLKDTLLRLYKDRRKGEDIIASKYAPEWLHHLHSIIRTLHTNANISPEATGSCIVLKADNGDFEKMFDYRDINGVNTALIRIGDKAFVFAVDDAKMSLPFLKARLNPLSGHALSPIQLREMLAHLTYVKKSFIEPPAFRSEYDLELGISTLKVTLPEKVDLQEYKYEDYGEVLYLCTFDLLDKLGLPSNVDIHSQVKSGRVGFTVDENYNFVRQSGPRKP